MPSKHSLSMHTASGGMKSWLNCFAGLGVTMVPSFEGSDSNDSERDSESEELMWLWDDLLREDSSKHSAQENPPASAVAKTDFAPGTNAGPTVWNPSSATKNGSSGPKQSSPSSVSSTSAHAAGRFVSDRRSGVQNEPVDDGPDISTYPDLPDDQRKHELEVIDSEVQNCQLCPDLVSYRSRTVFGQGPERPRLLFMGEAPGAEEDKQGLPMVGPAGQLLNKIIAAMKMKREDVYVLNTIKCRPPRNRNPLESECSNCRPFWRRQIEILKPDCIVCLGAVAAKTLLQTTLPVGRMRGKMHNFRGIPVAVTYHPAYLLRTASAKRQTWEDMQKVMTLLGIPIK